MAKKSSKKEVKPAKKKVQGVMEKHPVVQNGARGLFRNENGTTIVQERVPRGDLPQDAVIMPRTEGDLTDDDIEIIVKEAKSLIDPLLEKYDSDVASEDALMKALHSMGGGKYQGRVGANTQKLILDTMKGGKKEPARKKAADVDASGGTKGEIAEEAKAKGLIRQYDTALPQQWLDEFVRKVGGEEAYGKILSSFVWAYDDKGAMGFPYPLTPEAEELLKKHYPRYHENLPKGGDKQAADIDTLIESIPITTGDVGGTPKREKPPKEGGMDKEMLRKEAKDLSRKLDALKVLLCEDGDSEEVEACAKLADDEGTEKEAGKKGKAVCDKCGKSYPAFMNGCPHCAKASKKKKAADEEASEVIEESTESENPEVESADASVVTAIDEIAGMVEKEARDNKDLDLFRIAFQLDCVSDYLSGEKDAAVLQSDPDEDFMRKAFHAGALETDSDEPYMKDFNVDPTKEVAGVVGKTASALPYAVKKDA